MRKQRLAKNTITAIVYQFTCIICDWANRLGSWINIE